MHQPYTIPTERKRKMVPCTEKYDKVGKKRLRKIHSRVNYLAEECGSQINQVTKYIHSAVVVQGN